MCTQYYHVSKIKQYGWLIYSCIIYEFEINLSHSKSFREVFTYNGRVLEAGEIMKRPTYARTLRIISNAGNADPVYGGVLGQQMVKDINTHGGQFMIDDLKNYKVRFRDTITESFGKGKLLTTPPPTSGPVLSLVLNILKGSRRIQNYFE